MFWTVVMYLEENNWNFLQGFLLVMLPATHFKLHSDIVYFLLNCILGSWNQFRVRHFWNFFNFLLITVSFIFRTVLERSKINIDTVLTYCRCSLNDVGVLDYMNFFKVRFKAALSWQLVGNKMCLNWLSMLHLKANLLSMLPVSKLTPNTPPLKQILFY